jgi:hypothetical protein
MTEITVQVLDESEWSVYREVRLRALAESPGSFTATLAEEADRDEQFWRDRMTPGERSLASPTSTGGRRDFRSLRMLAASCYVETVDSESAGHALQLLSQMTRREGQSDPTDAGQRGERNRERTGPNRPWRWSWTSSRTSAALRSAGWRRVAPRRAPVFLVQLAFFAAYSGLVTYTLATKWQAGALPALLFAVAMGLHIFANDHVLAEHFPVRLTGRWWFVLAGGALTGWVVAVAVEPTGTPLINTLTAFSVARSC